MRRAIVQAALARPLSASAIRSNVESTLHPRAAVAVTVWRDEALAEVLLVKRGQEPGKGTWSLPGGKLEFGESLSEGAARELAEETNIAIPSDRIHFFTSTDVVVKDGAVVTYHYVISQATVVADANAMPVAGDDADAVGWFRAADLEDGSLTVAVPSTGGGPISPGVAGVVGRARRLLPLLRKETEQ